VGLPRQRGAKAKVVESIGALHAVLGGADGQEALQEPAHCLIMGARSDALSLLSALEMRPTGVTCEGLDSYLAELPTCLTCLDRIDPAVIQVRRDGVVQSIEELSWNVRHCGRGIRA
jgi:hypothetical protein